MNELLLIITGLLAGATMMLALLGLGITVIVPNIDPWSKRFFNIYFSVLVLYISFCIADGLVSRHSTMKLLLIIAYYFETVCGSVLITMMNAFLVHCCGENWQHSPLSRAAAALWGVFFIVLNFTPFTTWFYYISSDNQFYRGPLYPVITALLGAITVLNLASVIYLRSRLSRKYYYALLIGFLPMTIAIFIHLFVSVFILLGLCISVCALSMFFLILSDQIEQYMRQQRKVAHQRTSIMVLQMRPHFIYNTMMSIYYLCKQNPDLAQQVTLDFTTYLRKNFTAIASESLIPFSEELEHTRAYLAVEQAQFEDRLFIEYDTPHTDFRLPPLTLQPIVENAVKHGMDPDSEPLYISIRTRRTDSGSEIIVENSGADFEPSIDSEPHIAISNIQQRLEMMCRGKLTITPRNGGGTVVKMVV